MEKSFRFIFQDTDALDIPVKMVRAFDVDGIPKWMMRISGDGDELYKPFGVLPPIRKFWSLQNKNLTQLRVPECVIDGVRYLANAIDTYDNDKSCHYEKSHRYTSAFSPASCSPSFHMILRTKKPLRDIICTAGVSVSAFLCLCSCTSSAATLPF